MGSANRGLLYTRFPSYTRPPHGIGTCGNIDSHPSDTSPESKQSRALLQKALTSSISPFSFSESKKVFCRALNQDVVSLKVEGKSSSRDVIVENFDVPLYSFRRHWNTAFSEGSAIGVCRPEDIFC